MSQTKKGSFIESWANVAVGFGINYTANMIVLPWFGFNVSYAQAFGIGVIFTGISIARSYVLRRWFNSFKWDKVQSQVDTGVKPEVVVSDNVSTSHVKEYNG